MRRSSLAPVRDRSATIYDAIGLGGDPFARDPLAGAYVPLRGQEQVRHTVGTWLEAHGDDQFGLAVVSGESGSGKTRLLDQLVTDFVDNDDRLIGIVPDDGTRRSDAHLLRAAIRAFGGTPAGRTGLELTHEVRSLADAHRDDPLAPVLLIDNAALTGSQLEILRNVLAPAPGESTPAPIQIVLFGPPELADRIERRRSLAGFVRRAATLPAIDATEMAQLLEGRIAACRHDRDGADPLIEEEALAAIWEAAGGNPGAGIAIAQAALREAIASGRQAIEVGIVRSVLAIGRGQPDGLPRHEAAGVVQTRLSLPGLDNPTEAVSPPARRRGRQQ